MNVMLSLARAETVVAHVGSLVVVVLANGCLG
jgi:hypothetical protein